MLLVDTDTQQTISEAALRLKYPLVSFPTALTAHHLKGFSVAELIPTEQPDSSEFSSTRPGPNVERDGVWYTSWIQDPLPFDHCKRQLLGKIDAYTRPPVVTVKGCEIRLNDKTLSRLGRIANNSITVDFKCLNGWIRLQPSEALTLCDEAHVKIQQTYSNERKHHEAIAAIEEFKDVLTYDVTTGWPD